MDLGNNLKILFTKLHSDAKAPTYAFDWDACCDLYCIETFDLKPMERRLVRTGIAIKIPEGFEAQIRARSGLASKHGITVISGVGTIDATYRGEIKVPLINLGDEPMKFVKGDRIAQMKFAPVYIGHFLETASLDMTSRGTGGFGHTGM